MIRGLIRNLFWTGTVLLSSPETHLIPNADQPDSSSLADAWSLVMIDQVFPAPAVDYMLTGKQDGCPLASGGKIQLVHAKCHWRLDCYRGLSFIRVRGRPMPVNRIQSEALWRTIRVPGWLRTPAAGIVHLNRPESGQAGT